jgi:hypothetical protein
VSLKLSSKALLALPLPRIIAACTPLSLTALHNLTQHCFRTKALHVDVSHACWDSVLPRDVQGLMGQWMGNAALPLEQLWVSGDAPCNSSANHLWLFALLRRLAQLRVFALSTFGISPLPNMESLCHLVLDLRWQNEPLHEPHGQSSVLGRMSGLQSLKVSFLEKGHEQNEHAVKFSWWLSFDLGSCKQLRHLMLEHAVPQNWDWAVPPDCIISLKSAAGMLMYPQVPFESEEDVDEPPTLLELVNQQLTYLHLTCNTVQGYHSTARVDSTHALMVLNGGIPLGGIYSRLRVLKITCRGFGSPDHPVHVGNMFDALDVLQVHALHDVVLDYDGEGLRPKVLDLQCGGVLNVRMPDARVFGARLAQLHVMASCLGPELDELLEWIWPNYDAQREEKHVFDVWCPPCSKKRLAELLRCGCGACMACLRREGKLVL